MNMPGTTVTSKTSVERIVERILKWKKITPIDQSLLMSALLSKDCISQQEKSQIDRLFDALNSGLLRVV